MQKPLFYAAVGNIGESEAVLAPLESNHAASVMRLRPGDGVIIVDGLGGAYRGSIGTISKKKTIIKIYDQLRNFGEPSTKVTLAVGLLPVGRFKTIVEEATTLGVSRFVSLLTQNSEQIPGTSSRTKARVTSLEKVALTAMMQSRRSYRPIISQPTEFEAFINETDTDSLNLIFNPESKTGRFENHIDGFNGKRVTILIGPETGFTPDEFNSATAAGFKPVSLGQRLLKAETASIATTALVMNALGELS